MISGVPRGSRMWGDRKKPEGESPSATKRKGIPPERRDYEPLGAMRKSGFGEL